MRRITIDIHNHDSVTEHEIDWMIMPRPFNDGEQSFVGMSADGISELHEIRALNSKQHAYLLKLDRSKKTSITYAFSPEPCSRPDWCWQLESNRYTEASGELANVALDICKDTTSQSEAVDKLMQHASEVFGYGHADQRFNDECDQVPNICGTTKGSCVDINTYLIACSRSLGIPVQYMAGYWIHPEKNKTHDMHCWLMFKLDGVITYWDLAHHLKWGVKTLGPGLNPAGGRRVPMSMGRGLRFVTTVGEVEFSHFSEPHWLLPDGSKIKPELSIHLTSDHH
jgi:hypothetical protein